MRIISNTYIVHTFSLHHESSFIDLASIWRARSFSFSPCKQQKVHSHLFCSRICTYNYQNSSRCFVVIKKFAHLLKTCSGRSLFIQTKASNIARSFCIYDNNTSVCFYYGSLISYYVYSIVNLFRIKSINLLWVMHRYFSNHRVISFFCSFLNNRAFQGTEQNALKIYGQR